MDIYEWLVEQEQETLLHLEDEQRSATGVFEVSDKQVKTWDVTIAIPGQEPEVIRVWAVDNMGAKTEACKQYYGHVFTGQYKYMRARVVTEDEIDQESL